MPLAQSMELPPPTLTIRSTVQRPGEGGSRLDVVVGRVFLDRRRKERPRGPAAAATRMARCGCPAVSRPGSVTSRARVQPSSWASSPRRLHDAGAEDNARRRVKVERRPAARGEPGRASGKSTWLLLPSCGNRPGFARVVSTVGRNCHPAWGAALSAQASRPGNRHGVKSTPLYMDAGAKQDILHR